MFHRASGAIRQATDRQSPATNATLLSTEERSPFSGLVSRAPATMFFFQYQLSKENLRRRNDNVCIDSLCEQYQTMKGTKKCSNLGRLTRIVIVALICLTEDLLAETETDNTPFNC